MWFTLGKKRVVGQWLNFEQDLVEDMKLGRKKTLRHGDDEEAAFNFIIGAKWMDGFDKAIMCSLVRKLYSNEYFRKIIPPYIMVDDFKVIFNLISDIDWDSVQNVNEILQSALDTSLVLFLFYRNKRINAVEKVINFLGKYNVHNLCDRVLSLGEIDLGRLVNFINNAVGKNYGIDIIFKVVENYRKFLEADNFENFSTEEINNFINIHKNIGLEYYEEKINSDTTEGKILRYLKGVGSLDDFDFSLLGEAARFYDWAILERMDRDEMPDIPIRKEIYLSDLGSKKKVRYEIVMRKIPYDDVRQLFLGNRKEYQCCYLWNGESEDALRDSIANPRSGNYELLLISDGGRVKKLATSYAWYDSCGVFCFDNIEQGYELKNGDFGIVFSDGKETDINKIIGDIYIDAAEYLESVGVPRITIGKGYTNNKIIDHINKFCVERNKFFRRGGLEHKKAKADEKYYSDAKESGQIIICAHGYDTAKKVLENGDQNDLVRLLNFNFESMLESNLRMDLGEIIATGVKCTGIYEEEDLCNLIFYFIDLDKFKEFPSNHGIDFKGRYFKINIPEVNLINYNYYLDLNVAIASRDIEKIKFVLANTSVNLENLLNALKSKNLDIVKLVCEHDRVWHYVNLSHIIDINDLDILNYFYNLSGLYGTSKIVVNLEALDSAIHTNNIKIIETFIDKSFYNFANRAEIAAKIISRYLNMAGTDSLLVKKMLSEIKFNINDLAKYLNISTLKKLVKYSEFAPDEKFLFNCISTGDIDKVRFAHEGLGLVPSQDLIGDEIIEANNTEILRYATNIMGMKISSETMIKALLNMADNIIEYLLKLNLEHKKGTINYCITHCSKYFDNLLEAGYKMDENTLKTAIDVGDRDIIYKVLKTRDNVSYQEFLSALLSTKLVAKSDNQLILDLYSKVKIEDINKILQQCFGDDYVSGFASCIIEATPTKILEEYLRRYGLNIWHSYLSCRDMEIENNTYDILKRRIPNLNEIIGEKISPESLHYLLRSCNKLFFELINFVPIEKFSEPIINYFNGMEMARYNIVDTTNYFIDNLLKHVKDLSKVRTCVSFALRNRKNRDEIVKAIQSSHPEIYV